jgi:hypothetical protein
MKSRNELIEHQTIIDVDGNFQFAFGGNIVPTPFVLHIQARR